MTDKQQVKHEVKTDEKGEVVAEETVIIIGPDIMHDIWEIVRTNRAGGKPSMAKVFCTNGGAKRVEEMKIPRREDEQ